MDYNGGYNRAKVEAEERLRQEQPRLPVEELPRLPVEELPQLQVLF
jgi:hypothetical protein